MKFKISSTLNLLIVTHTKYGVFYWNDFFFISEIQRLHVPEIDSASTDSDEEIYYSDTEEFHQHPSEKTDHHTTQANDNNNQIDDSLESNYYSAENNEIIDHNEVMENDNIEESKADEMIGHESFIDLSNKGINALIMKWDLLAFITCKYKVVRFLNVELKFR